MMPQAPGLLHELKAAFELVLQVLDHQREGKPLPMQMACGMPLRTHGTSST
jgi:hypothetical protein